MNKKGFTLVELLTVIVIIGLIMIIVYPSIINIMNDNNDEVYASYEKMMEEYAKASPLKTRNKILLSELDGLDEIKRKCSGYVLINHTATPETYKAYIKCTDKHTTSGYNESLG